MERSWQAQVEHRTQEVKTRERSTMCFGIDYVKRLHECAQNSLVEMCESAGEKKQKVKDDIKMCCKQLSKNRDVKRNDSESITQAGPMKAPPTLHFPLSLQNSPPPLLLLPFHHTHTTTTTTPPLPPQIFQSAPLSTHNGPVWAETNGQDDEAPFLYVTVAC